MQLGEDNTESNLFIQPHLQSPSCLLSFQTWQTNKYTHRRINARRHTDACTALRTRIHFMKETEVLRLSRRWNLEKWKCCICILICPQSGIVFGVAAKLPGVCSSSLFIGTTWDTGPKFKSACYHSVWRWGFLSLFFSCPSSAFASSVTHSLSLSLCLSSSVTLHFFITLPPSLIISPYFRPSHLPFFYILFFSTSLSLSPFTFVPTHFSLLGESECTDFISDAERHAARLRRARAVMEPRPCSALIICHPIPLFPPPTPMSPFDIFRPSSIRSFRSSRLWHGHKLSVAD